MIKNDNYIISYFSANNHSQPTNQINIFDVFQSIQNDNYLLATNKIRNEKDKKKRDFLKLNTLSAITVSGLFNVRKKEELIQHSGLIQIDIDNITQFGTIAESKEILCKDVYTFACWVSPSANGLKLIVKIPADIKTHALNYAGIEQYYVENYHIQIDKKCKDITRLMFLSADSDIFINQSAAIFSKELYFNSRDGNNKSYSNGKMSKFEHESDEIRKEVELIIQNIEQNQLNITQNYNDWLNCAYSFADVFDESGRIYFHTVSKFFPNYEYSKTNKVFDSCLRNKKGNGIAPFFNLAKRFNLIQTNERIKKFTNSTESTVIKALIPDSSNIETENSENGFYILNSCYYTNVVKGKAKNEIKLSNFVMQILYHLNDGTNDTRRIIKLQRLGISKLVEVYSSQTGIDKFETILKSNSCSFLGTNYQLKNIFSILMDIETEAKAIRTLGWQSDEQAYAFADAIINVRNEILFTNSLGIIYDNGKNYYLPAFSEINQKNENFTNERLFRYKKGNTSFATWAQLFYNAYGIKGGIAIQFVILALFRDIVFNEVRFFPYLFLFGDFGAGKTSFIELILSLFGEDTVGTSLNGSTSVGLSRITAQRVNSIFYFKEYTNETDEKTQDLILNGYDGVSRTTGTKTNDNQTKNSLVRSAVIFDGNELPTSKAAIFSRMILINFEKQKYSEKQSSAFYELKNRKNEGFNQIIQELMKFRNEFAIQFKSIYLQNISELKASSETEDFDDRMINHIALLCSTYQILHTKLVFPFSFETLLHELIESAKEQNRILKQSQASVIFWLAMEYYRNSEHKHVIEGNQYLKDNNYIYIKYELLFPFYSKYCIQNKITSVAKSSLLELLTSKNNPAFVPNDMKSRSGKAYIKKGLGSCYRFKITYLDDTIKINELELKL